MLRDYIYELITKESKNDKSSKWYNYFICVVAVISMVPIMFKTTNNVLEGIDLIVVYLLFMDYILRWTVADKTSERLSGVKAFVVYPVTPYAILDLASLLPSLGLIGYGWRVLRVFRIVKLFHYSKNFAHIMNVMKTEKERLGSVLVIAIGYIFISALIMFSYETETFNSFFDALYWATTALTTVGYGDVYPVTMIGKLISMLSSVFGIAVIALPAGIITGGFLEELKGKEPKDDEEQ